MIGKDNQTMFESSRTILLKNQNETQMCSFESDVTSFRSQR